MSSDKTGILEELEAKFRANSKRLMILHEWSGNESDDDLFIAMMVDDPVKVVENLKSVEDKFHLLPKHLPIVKGVLDHYYQAKFILMAREDLEAAMIWKLSNDTG